MKKIIIFSLFVLVGITQACKQKSSDDTNIPPSNGGDKANVSIQFNNVVGNEAIEKGVMKYTNSAGNLYSVDLLKYYVTHVVLIKDDGSQFELKNYDLINAFDNDYKTVEASNVPNGNYTGLKFNLGVDKVQNKNLGTGDLDPIHNMSWGWNFGYIFFKHEGNFKDVNNLNNSVLFHLGLDTALSEVTLPITLLVNGKNRIMKLQFDLNKMYNSPQIDFNVDNNRMSNPGEENWMSSMKLNTTDAFSFLSVE